MNIPRKIILEKRGNKMKIQKALSSLICIILLLSVIATHVMASGEAKNWYIVKKGAGCSPDFPCDSEALLEYNAICIDAEAANSGEKIIYLTFDAGYENGNIERILDVLREKDVPAAFFILSNLINKSTDIVKRMADEGHLLCNHTKNHKDMTTLTDTEMQKNLEALEELCLQKVGAEMSKIFRFPEGKYSEEKLLLLKKLGYRTAFWSTAYDDWDNLRQPSEDVAMKKLIGQTHPGAIFLLHPTSETNAKILPKLIDYWRNEGYTFGRIDEM